VTITLNCLGTRIYLYLKPDLQFTLRQISSVSDSLSTVLKKFVKDDSETILADRFNRPVRRKNSPKPALVAGLLF